MTALRSYRHLIAAFLLVTYTFIATPVQLWHRHDTTSTSRHTVNKDLLLTNTTNTDSGCQVCLHKFSTYSDDALAIVLSLPIVYTARQDCYQLPLPASPAFSSPNKGPPATA